MHVVRTQKYPTNQIPQKENRGVVLGHYLFIVITKHFEVADVEAVNGSTCSGPVRQTLNKVASHQAMETM
jgi:hypothetical protein